MAFYFKHSHFHKTQFGDPSEASGQEVSFQTIVKTLTSRIKAAADEVAYGLGVRRGAFLPSQVVTLIR